jgi:hypothetical protein
MIEVRYAGAVVGRSAIVRELDTNGLFLGITEPMPVGTPVTLKIGDQTADGKVAVVSESQELARAGMRVRFSDPASAKLFGTPTEAPAEPEVVVAAAPPKAPEAAAPVAASAEDASKGTATRNTSGPRRIIVDASTENAAAPAQAAEEIDASGPVSTPAASNDPHRKNRRTKRR